MSSSLDDSSSSEEELSEPSVSNSIPPDELVSWGFINHGPLVGDEESEKSDSAAFAFIPLSFSSTRFAICLF